MTARPLAVAGAVRDGETVGLRCEGGTIAAIGADVTPEPGDETTHAAMTLFRGYGGDLPLMRWLRARRSSPPAT